MELESTFYGTQYVVNNYRDSIYQLLSESVLSEKTNNYHLLNRAICTVALNK